MQVKLDGVVLPSGVEVFLADGPGATVTLRGTGSLVRQLGPLRDEQERTLEILDDTGQLVAKAIVKLTWSHLSTASGQPDDEAAIDVQGPARGGMPDGSLYPQPT